MSKIRLLAGRSHPELAASVANILGIDLMPLEIKNFADGEIYLRILKKVRGDDVFVLQSLIAPVNERLMETLIMVDALRRASAGKINLICPYMCYSRQDRKVVSREPITAKLVANLLTKAGIDRLVTVDLHADQIQGFYDIPVDHFVGYPQFAKYLKEAGYKDMVVVSPDVGGVKRANKMADLLGLPIAVMDKVRREHNKAEVAHIVGDVEGKTAVLLDDIIDTAGSMSAAADTVKKFGAKRVLICATHALLSGEAGKKLSACGADKIVVLDSVPVAKENRIKKMEILTIAPLLAKIIKRIHSNRSLGELFTWERARVRL